jgi:REP element-mobilizing transposase RayT
MRQRRIKVWGEAAVYHCISRVVAGERLLDDAAKEQFRKMLWKTAAFCGVEVLTYCVLSNHVHLLIRVRSAEVSEVNQVELLRRYRAFYGEVPGTPEFPSANVLAAKFAEGGEEAVRWESRLRSRMGDVSEFMKTLKQRFTVWYNRTYRRFGTLWSERFKSVLVEDSAFALKTVAAYIDLNPVRAGLVTDPGTYRWCGYAEALAGKKAARKGLCRVVGVDSEEWRGGLESYRAVLFGKGAMAREIGQATVDLDHADAVLRSGGRLDREELLRARVRYFTDGVVLGSKEFVRQVGVSIRRPGQTVEAVLDGNADGLEYRKDLRRRAGAVEIPMKSEEAGASLTVWRKPRMRPGAEVK